MSNFASIKMRYVLGIMLCISSLVVADESTQESILENRETSEDPNNSEQPPRYLNAGDGSNPTAALEYLSVQQNRAAHDETLNNISENETPKELLQSIGCEKCKDKNKGSHIVSCLDHDKNKDKFNGCKDCAFPNAMALKIFDINKRAYIYVKYITTHPGAVHTMLLPGLLAGGSIQLEDFSIWTVNPYDTYKVMNWVPSDQIVIRGIWYSNQFIIENLSTGVEVQASLTQYLNPFYHTFANHQIIAKDSFLNLIWLEDGTVWKIYSLDFLTSWQIGDTIILGINDDWLSDSTYPNILINARLLQYVRASTTY